MLKKIFKKDGIIFLQNDQFENINLSYFIIHNYNFLFLYNDHNKNICKKINEIKKKYYESIGYLY